jgi:flavin-dependent dehydrogenase
VRSEFDRLMLDHAREHGVDVHEGARVHDVLFEDGRAVGVRVRDGEGFRDVRATVVVDASGQNGLLMNRLGLRIWDPILSMGAIWTYWRGARRDAGRDAGATLVIQSGNKRGWFWYIPLHGDLTSVGVVAPFDYLFKGRGAYTTTYDEEMALCPGARERVLGATQATGHFATKDFSYRSTQVAGDGWVLVGDAFGFLDPLYSSGILLALKSGELAADAIVEGLATGDTSGAQLGKWGPTFNRGIDRMRRLVCEYYAGFSFGKMMHAFPDMRGPLTDLLIGDLFRDEVDRVWGPLESMYESGRPPVPDWDAGRRAHPGDAPEVDVVLPDGLTP